MHWEECSHLTIPNYRGGWGNTVYAYQKLEDWAREFCPVVWARGL